MGDIDKKQQAINQLEQLVASVEENFVTDDVVSWEQLFVLYYCITSMDDDIPSDLLQKIKDCGLAAYMFLMGQGEQSEGDSQCNNAVDKKFRILQDFFETGQSRKRDPLFLTAVQTLAYPEYVKTLILKEN